MDFNPNQPAKKKEFFWSTFIPNRRPKFKMYANRGHALNSFQYKSSGILYEWDEQKNEWTEIYRVENFQKSNTCQHCNKNLITHHKGRYDSWDSNSGHRVWADKKTNKPYLVWVCRDCERAMR